MSAQITEQVVREAPEIEAEKLWLIREGRKLAEQQGFAGMLPGYQVAGFSPEQVRALSAASQMGVGSFDPYLQAAGQGITGGQQLTQQAAQALTGADTRNQFYDAQRAMQQAGQAAAGISSAAPTIGAGIQALGAAGDLSRQYSQADLGAAYGQLGRGAGIIGQGAAEAMGAAGMYDPRSAAAFMNPYQQEVTRQALGEMRRQGDIARMQQEAQAVRSGAFGGTREGVQRAEMERGLQDLMSQRIFQDYAQNFAQAQQAAMTAEEAARQRQLGISGALTSAGAQQAGIGQTLGQFGMGQAGLGQQAAGLQAQLGSQYGNLAGQQANIYGQQAGLLQNLGMGIGSLAGQQFGIGQQISSGLGQLGAQQGQLGLQQAALGQTAQALQQGDINFLYNIGQQQQALQQQQLDAQRSSQMQQLYAPYQQLAFLSDIQRGAPSTQMATTAAAMPQASPFQQLVGTGVGVAATAAGLKKAGVF